MTPDAFRTFIQSEARKWTRVMLEAGSNKAVGRRC
jgi:hypothetical protein